MEGTLSAPDWVARAKELVPLVAASAPQVETLRRLPDEVVDALHESGLLRLLIPRSCGGAEADIVTFAEVVEALATGDASTAWCVGQLAPCAMSAAYVDLQTAREIFGAPRFALAWGPPRSAVRADAVPGGYRVSGTWQFASGSRHATWLGGTTPVFERDGSQRLGPDGRPEIRTVLFPRADATIADVWQVVGLRGTGSDQYGVVDFFVPEERTFTRDRYGWREPGPLYRLSMVYLHALAFGAIALGVARATLEDFVVLAKSKTPFRVGARQLLSENNAVQGRVGYAEAQLRAGRAFLLDSARRAYEEASTIADGTVALETRVDMRAACTFAIGQAEQVVDMAYRGAGSDAIFENRPFERRFRDMHAIVQQGQGALANYETVGQYRFGAPVNLMM